MIFGQNMKLIIITIIKHHNSKHCFWNPAWSKCKHVYKPVGSFINNRVCQYVNTKIVFLSKINHSSILFSFWATFNSFVNARYSDISVDCNDFKAGFLITYRNIAISCIYEWIKCCPKRKQYWWMIDFT
jgi:hypothetical protein